MRLRDSRPMAMAARTVVLLLAVLAGVDAVCKPSNVNRPACGVNNKTYKNPEAAACANVKIKHPGPCAICPAIAKCAKAAKLPVCVKGKVYCSACVATALKLKFVPGPCRPPCPKKGASCKPGAPRACCPGLTCSGNAQVGICTGTEVRPGGPGGGPGGLPGGGPGGLPGGGPGGRPGGGPGGQPGSGVGGIGGIGGGLG